MRSCFNSLKRMNYLSDFIPFRELIIGRTIAKTIAKRNEVSQSITATP